jgi:hypothetical protein
VLGAAILAITAFIKTKEEMVFIWHIKIISVVSLFG